MIFFCAAQKKVFLSCYIRQELLDKAKGLVAEGLKMIESHEQSRESLKMKCDEIKKLCNKFYKAVQKREDDLKEAIDIHKCLEMVTAVVSYY